MKSFQVAQLAYDVTVRFCDRYIEKRGSMHAAMLSGELRLTSLRLRKAGVSSGGESANHTA